MSNRLTFSGFFLSLLFAISAMLSGCGGGGASSGTTTPITTGATVTGTAATGFAMAGATIIVKDSTGAQVGTTTAGSDGTFGVTLLSSAVPPLILRADPSPHVTGGEQYALFIGTLSTTDSSLNRVDITPATSLVVYEATQKDLTAVFAFPATYIASLTNSNITQAELHVISQFPALSALSDKDLLHQVLTVGNPYDLALDSMGVKTITFSGDIPTLKNAAGVTIPYNSNSGSTVGSVTVDATNSSIPVGGSTTTIRALVKDTSSAPLSGVVVSFTTTAGSLSISSATTDSTGYASVTLISGPTLLTAKATASAGGASSSVNVSFTAGAAAAVGMNAAPNAVKPGGTSTLTAAVLDVSGNPVANEPVTFSFSSRGSTNPSLSAISGQTDINGLVSVTYTAGSCAASCTDTVSARTSNNVTGSVATISVSSANAVVGSVITTATNPSIKVGGSTTTIRAQVLDVSNVSLSGLVVQFTTTAGSLSSSTATTDANGYASVTLTSGSAVLTAKVSASIAGFTSIVNVNFTAGAAAAVGVNATPSTLQPGGTSTVTAAVLDGYGNPVVNEPVTFFIASHASTNPNLSAASGQTDANGLVSVTYTAGSCAASCSDTVSARSSNNVTGSVATISITTGNTASLLSIATNQTTVKSDNSNSATITVTALNSSNVVVTGVTINFTATGGGQVSAGSVITDASGQAIVKVSSGSADKTNRTVTVSATASTGSATPVSIPIQIVGSTLSLSTPNASLSVGNATTLKASAHDAGGIGIFNTQITFADSGSGTATHAVSGLTDVNGDLTITVTASTATSTGSPANPHVITASGVGATATQAYTFSAVAASLQITAPSANPVALVKGIPLAFTATAPAPIVNVRFSTTLGKWTTCPGTGINTSVCLVPVATPTATLTSTLAGTANILVEGLDASSIVTSSDTRVVGITAAAASAFSISLQSSVSVLAKNSANGATLTATVRDSSNAPVGNALVVFSITNPTGGGETLLPVVQTTADGTGGIPLGQARTSFSSGSLPSTGDGVVLQAMVVGSGNGICPVLPPLPPGPGTAICATTKINIGGTAGSIAIGTSSVIFDLAGSNGTAYQAPMSVLVADSNGNPVANSQVSLSVWPIYFFTGTYIGSVSNCTLNWAGATFGVSGGTTGKFANEDDFSGFGNSNYENLILDALEDGSSPQLVDNVLCPGCFTTGTYLYPSDGALTPPNSSAGSLPSTATTDANGVYTFNLTYLKQYASWIAVRVRAKALVQGSEATSEIVFRLYASKADMQACILPNSPF